MFGSDSIGAESFGGYSYSNMHRAISLLDTVKSTDASTISSSKSISDKSNSNDLLLKSLNPLLLENQIVNDSITKKTGLSLMENILSLDSTTKTNQIGLSDSISSIDLLSKVGQKSFSDNANSTESLVRNALVPLNYQVNGIGYSVLNSNDGYENGGAFYLGSGLILGRLIGQTYYSGVRFLNINVPQGSIIVNAALDVSAAGYQSGSTVVQIRVLGVANDNSSLWSSSNNPQFQTTTSSHKDASITASSWPNDNSFSNSPFPVDVTSIVQEIVNRSGWIQGNALSLLIWDNGSSSTDAVFANSFGIGATNAAKLSISFNTLQGKLFSFPLSDAVSSSDSMLKSMVKPLNEKVITNESIIGKAVSQSLSDAILSNDSLGKMLVQAFYDSGTMSDSISFIHSITVHMLNLYDTVDSTDSISRVFGNALSESISSNDSLIGSVSKVITDTVKSTDSLEKSNTQTLTESALSNESVVKGIKQSLKDTVASIDTLILNPYIPVMHILNLFDTVQSVDTIKKEVVTNFTEQLLSNDSIITELGKTLITGITNGIDIDTVPFGSISMANSTSKVLNDPPITFDQAGYTFDQVRVHFDNYITGPIEEEKIETGLFSGININ